MLRGKDYQPFFHLAAANLQIIIELCKENLLKMQMGLAELFLSVSNTFVISL